MLQQVGVYYVKAGEIVFSEDSGSLLIRPCSNPPSACSLESYLADIKKKVEHGGAVVDGTGELVSVESLAKDERDRLSEIFFASSEGNLIVLPND